MRAIDRTSIKIMKGILNCIDRWRSSSLNSKGVEPSSHPLLPKQEIDQPLTLSEVQALFYNVHSGLIKLIEPGLFKLLHNKYNIVKNEIALQKLISTHFSSPSLHNQDALQAQFERLVQTIADVSILKCMVESRRKKEEYKLYMAYKITLNNNIDPYEATKEIIGEWWRMKTEKSLLYCDLIKGTFSAFKRCNDKLKAGIMPEYEEIPKFNLTPEMFIPAETKYSLYIKSRLENDDDPRAKKAIEWLVKSIFNYTKHEARGIPIVYPQDVYLENPKISEARDAMIKQLLSAPLPFSLKEVLEKAAHGEDLGPPILATDADTTNATAAVEVSSDLKSAAAAAVPEYASSPPQKIPSPYPESAEVTPSDGRSPQDINELDESTTVPQNQAQEWNNISWEE
jgi:hypothetical protein